MRVEDNILIIENEIGDEEVDEFMISISQDNINKIKVRNPNLGPSIIQALLIKKREVEIDVEDKILQKVFENISYKSI